MRSLGQVVAELRGEEVPEAPPVAPMSGARLLGLARARSGWRRSTSSDLLGMADARYAVEVAAAGGHHLLLSGPKGAGKTSIAERIPGILPDLTRDGVARADRDPLARRHPRPGRRDARPAAVLRAAPRRQQGQPDRRRQRPGPSRRGQPGPLRACCSSTSSRCSAPT